MLSITKNRAAYLLGALRIVRSLDSVVIVGTGGLEHTGAFGTPFEIWALGIASRIFRRPFVLLDIGVDRSKSRLTRMFTRSSGRLASYRSYRDESSRSNMIANGLHAASRDPVVTDMALSLEASCGAMRDPTLVVLGVMDYRGADDDDLRALEDYRERCTRIVDGLLAAGFRVTLVAGDDEDLPTARYVAHQFSSDAVTLAAARTPAELTLLMSEASTVVAARYHTLIMSLLARTPVVSIGYSEKHRAMLRQFSLPDTHQDSSEFDPAEVVALVTAAVAHREDLSARIDHGVASARQRLDAHWPEVLATLSRRARVTK